MQYRIYIYFNRPGTSSKFSTRTNAGEVVVKYPADDAVINWTRSNEKWKPSIQLHGTAETKLTTKYNYMFSRLKDKFDVLEEQVNDLGDLMKKKLGLDEFEPNNILKSVVLFNYSFFFFQSVILFIKLCYRKPSIRWAAFVVMPPVVLD